MVETGTWLGAWRFSHARILTTVTLVVALVYVSGVNLSLTAQIFILSVGVAFVGLPHGALDHLIARCLFLPVWGRLWPLPFLIIYGGLIALVLLGWVVAPLLMLVLFLAVSCLHFGLEDVERNLSPTHFYWVEVLARGAMVIVITSYFFTSQVAQIFVEMMPTAPDVNMTALVKTAATALLSVQLPVLVALIAFHLRQSKADPQLNGQIIALEIIALALLFAFVPPLLSFTLYFCGWHSLRHTFQLATLLDKENPRRGLITFAKQAVPLTFAVIVAAIIVWLLKDNINLKLDQSGIQIVFVALSALTFPHMTLRVLMGRNLTLRLALETD